MNVSTAEYNGNRIRFLALPDNGLLLNTKDVCEALGITSRPAGTELGEPCLDLAGAIGAALSDDVGDVDFVEWLQETFANYRDVTLVRPRCNDEWNFEP
jgi:hypothetical protein